MLTILFCKEFYLEKRYFSLFPTTDINKSHLFNKTPKQNQAWNENAVRINGENG